MLDAARATLAAVTAGQKTTAVLIRRATLTTSPTGGSTHDWQNPATVTTTTGRQQPANAELLEREGLQGLVNASVWYLPDVEVVPVTHRLFVGATVHKVLRVQRWEGAHTRVITEEIAEEVADSG